MRIFKLFIITVVFVFFVFNLFSSDTLVFSNHKKSGTLDYTFANNGIFIYKNHYSEGKSIIIDKENNIIVAGTISISDEIDNIAIWKITPTGKLVNNFSHNGIFIFENKKDSQANSIAIDKNDNIIIAGRIGKNMAIIKMDNQGNLIKSFGNNGIFMYPSGVSEAFSLKIDQNNNILVTGEMNNRMAVWKLDSKGNLINSFSNQGIFIDGNPESSAKSIIIINNDIFVVGNIYNPKPRLAIWKMNNNGFLDTLFANNGIFIYENKNINSFNTECSIIDNNSIWITGSVLVEKMPTQIGICKVDISGKIDSSFANNGILIYQSKYGSVGLSLAKINDTIFIAGMSIPYISIWKIDIYGNPVNSFANNGNFIWEETDSLANSITLDKDNNIYTTGWIEDYMAIWKLLP